METVLGFTVAKKQLEYSALVCKSCIRKIERPYKSVYEVQESRNQFSNIGQQLEVQSNSDVGQDAQNNQCDLRMKCLSKSSQSTSSMAKITALQ